MPPVLGARAMVRQKRVLFGVEDIRAVRLRCGGCGGDVILSSERDWTPDVCPSCSRAWRSLDSKEATAEDRLVSALTSLRALIAKGRRSVSIVLEIDNDDG